MDILQDLVTVEIYYWNQPTGDKLFPVGWYWLCHWKNVGLGPADEPSGPFATVQEATASFTTWLANPNE